MGLAVNMGILVGSLIMGWSILRHYWNLGKRLVRFYGVFDGNNDYCSPLNGERMLVEELPL